MGGGHSPDNLERCLKIYTTAFDAREPFEMEYRLRSTDGSYRSVFDQGSPRFTDDGEFAGYIGSCVDITERVHAQEQAIQHQAELAHVLRLSTISELASGMAHELNQPLTAISNYAKVCMNNLQDEDVDNNELVDLMSKISGQAVRASNIIRRLRDFMAKREPNYSKLNLNKVVRHAMGMVKADARSIRAKTRLKLHRHMPVVQADEILIEQVILNLVKNGLEAMAEGETPKRELTIHTDCKDGHTVRVAVCDTGEGISDDIKAKLFDEFVTTKPSGMGLGLSISRSIINSHGGELSVKTNDGGGTTFLFTLPVAA